MSPCITIEPHEPQLSGGCCFPAQPEAPELHTGGCGNIEISNTKPVIGCGALPSELEYKLKVGGCGNVEVPKIEDMVLSYPVLELESSLVLAHEVATDKVGAKEKPKAETEAHPHGIYKGHNSKHNDNSKGNISPGPIDGQSALDNSVQIKSTSPHRVGVSQGQIVILSQTCPGEFHGHVRTWEKLESEGTAAEAIRRALADNGFVNRRGKLQ